MQEKDRLEFLSRLTDNLQLLEEHKYLVELVVLSFHLSRALAPIAVSVVA